jgi:hypothetical protein
MNSPGKSLGVHRDEAARFAFAFAFARTIFGGGRGPDLRMCPAFTRVGGPPRQTNSLVIKEIGERYALQAG